MRKTLLWMIKAAIAGICAIVLLSIFCIVYSYEGVHITEPSGATDYTWESNQMKTTMKEGFSWLRMDENGYNNNFNYAEKPDILLMGSSHMEALQVAEDKNTGYLLNELIPNYKTYNIGVSGHTIYRCVDNLDEALDAYNPQKYVVLVVDAVTLETDSLKPVVENNAKPIPSYDSGAMYYMQKIPAVKTIYKQISDWMAIDYSTANENDVSYDSEEVAIDSDYEKYLNLFLSKADSESKAHGNQLIIVYQPPQSLSEDGGVVFHTDKNMLQMFEQVCKANRITFCDMTDAFSELYETENKLAHGFANSALGEGHLNQYGHREIAEEIANIVKELEGK